MLRPRRRTATGRSTAPLLDAPLLDPEAGAGGSALDAVIRPDSPQAVARRAATGRPDSAAPPTSGVAGPGGAGAGRRPVAPGTPAPTPRSSRPGQAAGPDRTTERAAAIRRTQVLVFLLVFTVVSWLGVAFSLLQSPVAWAATGLLAADLVALRAVVRHHEVARRSSPVPVGRISSPAPAGTTPAGSSDSPADGATAARQQPDGNTEGPAVRPVGAHLRRTLPPAAARRPAAHRVSRREVAAAEAGLPTADGTWMPVPVPPPTYTLKPKVPRPEPPSWDPGDGRPTGPAGPGGAAASATGSDADSGHRAAVTGADDVDAPAGPLPDRYEGVEPPAAGTRPIRQPRTGDREWADDLDLDAVLARRRAVNG